MYDSEVRGHNLLLLVLVLCYSLVCVCSIIGALQGCAVPAETKIAIAYLKDGFSCRK